MKVKKTERGWPGHFCCGEDCIYHRNTLLQYGDTYIVVSTVGKYLSRLSYNYRNRKDYTYETVRSGCYYETMAFFSDVSDTRYYDMDVNKQIKIDSDTLLDLMDADDVADTMHNRVVSELSRKLKAGTITTVI